MKRFAFFDVDYTLYDGYTASDLALYLVNIGVAPQQIREHYRQVVSKFLQKSISYNELAQMSLNLCAEALSGVSVFDGRMYVEDLLSQKKHVFFDWVNPVVRYVRSKGFELILISAGPNLMIEALASLLSVDYTYSTVMHVDRDVYTRKPPRLMNDDRKVHCIHDHLKSNDGVFSIGFGDSPGDSEMLKHVQHACVFRNPHHPEMVEQAMREGWNIFESKEEILSILEKILP